MLTEILRYIRNYFPAPEKAITGHFTIEGGKIGLENVMEGQHFLIEGSAMNDGIYIYPAEDLKDESFKGTVTPLAIPRDVIALAEEIENYTEQNKAAPYVSESFGGYSYTKATGKNGGLATWQEAYGTRLNAWRKI